MEKFMREAIVLAKRGEGYVNPNPMVGAVVVKNGTVIGEGYHERYGEAHAEINAIRHAKEDVRGSVLYVTLEPCSHFGKTPPCAKAIIECGIKKVVIGVKDPNPLVSGNGIRMLKEAGVEVEVGLLKEEVEVLYTYYQKYMTTKTPFCILKTAMTLDGKIATVTGDSRWITSADSRAYVHQIRHGVSAIMVGIGTVIADDPYLTTRLDGKRGKDPIRVIVDSKGRIPLNSNVLNIQSTADTIVATTSQMPEDKRAEIQQKGAKVIVTPTDRGRVDLAYLFKALGTQGIDSILLEGGAELNYSALECGVVDQVIAMVAPIIVGGQSAKAAVGGAGLERIQDAIKLKNVTSMRIGNDFLIQGMIKGR